MANKHFIKIASCAITSLLTSSQYIVWMHMSFNLANRRNCIIKTSFSCYTPHTHTHTHTHTQNYMQQTHTTGRYKSRPSCVWFTNCMWPCLTQYSGPDIGRQWPLNGPLCNCNDMGKSNIHAAWNRTPNRVREFRQWEVILRHVAPRHVHINTSKRSSSF